ncbi:MAG: TonB-dependent receptor, partial [Candidatus Omnitrophica bacterium]|nr:TonB-dependent receptor [Candidatus Omnitrophota bacterium]
VDVKIPFRQWTGDDGYSKSGAFRDRVHREFTQESFGSFGEFYADYNAPFDDLWSAVWPEEGHVVSDGGIGGAVDVDYEGEQEIFAWYNMIDLPLNSWFKIIGGVRYETTELSTVNNPEINAFWVPVGSNSSLKLSTTPGAADVSFKQEDVLPSMGFSFTPIEQITFRGSYSKTVARQTFKELSPIIQQEYLGGPVFVGNSELQMSGVTNYDTRLDYTPYDGGLVSFSWFYKKIINPIEYVQQTTNEFGFTRPVNYAEGWLSGFEIEGRQKLGQFFESLEGLSIGANATFIESEVGISYDDVKIFMDRGLQNPPTTRDMLNAPEYLYNIYLTYDSERFGTKMGLFYTVKGDTLVTGAGQERGHFVPDVYAKEYGTLNLSLSKSLGEDFELTFKAKNLTNPKIQEVYRSEFIDDEPIKASYTKGIDYTLGLSGKW